MIQVALPVLGLALLDSLNPSALAVTLYLLTQPRPGRTVPAYVAGIFCTYFAAGLLLLLGFGLFLERLGEQLQNPTAYAIQGVLGAGMLIYSLTADPKRAAQRPQRLPRSLNLGVVFLLGITITGVELTTALPYLGAIGMLTNAGLAPAQWLLLLLIYNIIFVLPPLLLLGANAVLGERLRPRMERWQARMQKEARELFLWIIAIIGFFLLADSLRYFEFFGLVDFPA